MTEMVERAARALAERHIREVRRWDTEPAKLEEIMPSAVDFAWRDFAGEARTAIEAMREPTDDMARAGFSSDAFRTPMLRLEADFEPKAVWQSMIDAALKP